MHRPVRLRLLVLTALTVALAATPALAQTTPRTMDSAARAALATPVKVSTLGRTGAYFSHFGNPNLGQVFVTAQGEGWDTNANGLADSLRGRGAALEVRGVTRLRVEKVLVQVDFADTWQPVIGQDVDAVSDDQPAYAVSRTGLAFRCPFPEGSTRLTYRTVVQVAIRWTDGTVGRRTLISNQYQFLAVTGTQLCPAAP